MKSGLHTDMWLCWEPKTYKVSPPSRPVDKRIIPLLIGAAGFVASALASRPGAARGLAVRIAGLSGTYYGPVPVAVAAKVTAGKPAPDLLISVYVDGALCRQTKFSPAKIGEEYDVSCTVSSVGSHSAYGVAVASNPLGRVEAKTSTVSFEIRKPSISASVDVTASGAYPVVLTGEASIVSSDPPESMSIVLSIYDADTGALLASKTFTGVLVQQRVSLSYSDSRTGSHRAYAEAKACNKYVCTIKTSSAISYTVGEKPGVSVWWPV